MVNPRSDREKIEDTIRAINSYLDAEGGDDIIDNWDGQTPRTLLEHLRLLLQEDDLTLY